MTQLHCARCWQPAGEITEGHINFGVRLICAKCDDRKMSGDIPHSLPEFLRTPAMNKHMARAGKEQK